MYSNLRYLLPAHASGAEWSSRLAKMEIRGVCGSDDGDDGDEKVGRG